MVLNATKKLDYLYVPAWKSTWAPVAVPPKEIVELVNKKWRLYMEKLKEGKEALEKEIVGLSKRISVLEKEWESSRKLMTLSGTEKEKEKHRYYPSRA